MSARYHRRERELIVLTVPLPAADQVEVPSAATDPARLAETEYRICCNLDFWWQVLADTVGSERARLVWTVIDSEPMRERLNDEVCLALGEATPVEGPDRTEAIGGWLRRSAS